MLLVCTALIGCDRSEIKVYRVAKEQPASPPMQGQGNLPAGHPDMGASAMQPRLAWKTPEGWTEITPGEMRVASFNIKGKDGKQADVSVIPLPGDAGGDSANVNRWRGQVGLQPVSSEELMKLAQNIEIAGQPAELYDISGQTPGSGDATRILGTIQHRNSTAWFFKMTGDDEIVAQQKSAFVEFLKSLRFESQEAAALPPSHPPIDSASMSSLLAAGASSDGSRPDWQLPAGWQEAPAGQFLVAKFILAGEGGAQTAVNVSRSAGDGGGLVPNLNRWRKQLGLAELSGPEEINALVKPLEIPGGQASLVDMSGTDARTGQPARLVAVMVPQGNQTWFYKLMGDAKVVENQKDSFAKFVRTAKY